MVWWLAPALAQLRSDVNKRAPGRSKAADGTIGDAAHSSRESDHNPEPDGSVDALDLTHDPRFDWSNMNNLTKEIIWRKDHRIKYIIWNRQICSGNNGPSPWRWRPYNGKNGHTKHAHFSILDSFQNNVNPWISGIFEPPQGDWFDMATQADLEAVVRKVMADRDRDVSNWNGSPFKYTKMADGKEVVVVVPEFADLISELWWAVKGNMDAEAGRWDPQL